MAVLAHNTPHTQHTQVIARTRLCNITPCHEIGCKGPILLAVTFDEFPDGNTQIAMRNDQQPSDRNCEIPGTSPQTALP
eukprot:12005248-Alexandrium_andersonii.AAC.1